MTIRFLLRGEIVELTEVDPRRSVLHWLREDAALRGTKEGCNQGDCGACTVVLGDLVDGEVRLSTANSCLLLLPKLDGRALFTIEDVGGLADLHPIQQEMVDRAGSQCGFCTPGFVMSMWCAAEQSHGPLSRDELADSLTGNLCRCTGYRPILDAGVAALAQELPGGGRIDRTRVADLLADMRDVREVRTHAPSTVHDLAQRLKDHPESRIVAGGTDLVVSWRAGAPVATSLIGLERMEDMRGIDRDEREWRIGAATSLEDTWAALVDAMPSLERMWRRFASPAIRSVGTVGGNLANASPIADLVPVLIAVDAELQLTCLEGTRTVAVEDFATGVRTTVLQPGEFIQLIRIPTASFTRRIHAAKVARRFDDDISAVSGTFAWRVDDGLMVDPRIVFGGMAITVRRARGAEAELVGRPWTEESVLAAQDALEQDFAPISDHRASADYRAAVARGLLRRWWLQARGVPVDVWSIT